MDYARFEALHRPTCEEFTRRLAAAQRQPRALSHAELEELAIRYRQLLHAHALADERFPGTAVARRLRAAALAGTHWLQRDPGDRLPGPLHFLAVSFPRACRRTSRLVGVTAALFLLAVLLGATLAAVEPALATAFLPPEALAGLRQGTLWTEKFFSIMPGSMASSAIATNNLTVALTAWAGGALAGLGALYVVLLNGFMLGAVVVVTAHYSVAGGLLEFVAAHGPLELTLILVSAAAGLDVGRALVMSDDRPRAEVVAEAGRRSLTVLLGALPWFLVLGVVESYVSPEAGIPWTAKVALGISLELLFLLVAWNPLIGEVRR